MTCDVDGCTKPKYQNKQMCGSHYMKWYRYGDPNHSPRRSFQDVTGHRFGALVARERTESGMWLCDCNCGGTTVTRIGDLNRGTVSTCGDRREHYRLDAVGYTAAHDRLRSDRGRVQGYSCVDCGDRAEQWSYDHSDPDELMCPRMGLPYSLDPECYSPRCVPCHKHF